MIFSIIQNHRIYILQKLHHNPKILTFPRINNILLTLGKVALPKAMRDFSKV